MLTGAENCLLFEYMLRWSSTFLRVLPIALVSNDENTTIDKIVRVCCALVNLCPSVVPHVCDNNY